MDLSSGYPFWLIKSGLLYDYPSLETNLKTNVVIMGGGISGALIAYKLVSSGMQCTLIDKRSIGLGSTCASTSLLQYEVDTPLCELMKMIGEEDAVEAYKLCSFAVDELERIAKKIGFKGFERRKSLYFAATKRDRLKLEKEYEARKNSGFEVSFLEEDQVRRKYNFSAPAAILSQQAAEANVYEFTHELLQYSMKLGLKVYDRTHATKIKYLSNGVLLNTEKGCTITANYLLYATGYETLKYIDKKYVQLKSTYAVCSEQINKRFLEQLSGMLYWNTADPYFYMRLTNDNRIMIGGRDEDFSDPVKRDMLLPQKVKALMKDFKKLFPGIPMVPEFSWTGTFSATKDGLPFIGKYKKLKHSYFSLGFGGNGITFSLIGAMIINDMLLGKENKYAHLFSFERI
jgi:glycine/D-amino acid oxidase-like deaminating enzyme